MRIEEETVAGFKTCGRDRRSHGDCPGYESAPISLIRETTTITFGDMHENTSDPYWPITSHQHVRLRPADEQDWKCSHCGEATNLSLEPRVEFPRLSEHSPNELVRRAQLERDRDQRAADSLSVEERQAIALERLAAGTGAALQRDRDLQDLRAELEQQREFTAQLLAVVNLPPAEGGNGNGHEPEPEPPGTDKETLTGRKSSEGEPPAAPRPRKRT